MASSHPAESGDPWSGVRASNRGSALGKPMGHPLFLIPAAPAWVLSTWEPMKVFLVVVPEPPHCFQGRT